MNYCFVESKKWPSEKSIRVHFADWGGIRLSHFRPASSPSSPNSTRGKKTTDKRLFVDSDKAITRPEWWCNVCPACRCLCEKKVTGCTAGCSLDFIRLMRPRRSRPNVMTLFKEKLRRLFEWAWKHWNERGLFSALKGHSTILNLKLIYESSCLISSLL